MGHGGQEPGGHGAGGPGIFHNHRPYAVPLLHQAQVHTHVRTHARTNSDIMKYATPLIMNSAAFVTVWQFKSRPVDPLPLLVLPG